MQEFSNLETVQENIRIVLYKKDVVELLQKQVLLVCNEDVTSGRRHNGLGAPCFPVIVKGFKNVEVVTVQRVKCSGTPKVYKNDRKIDDRGTQLVLFKYMSIKKASSIKYRACLIYLGHAVSLN